MQTYNYALAELVRNHGRVPDSFKLFFNFSCENNNNNNKKTQSSIKFANPKFTHQWFWKYLKWQDDFSPDEYYASDGISGREWVPGP